MRGMSALLSVRRGVCREESGAAVRLKVLWEKRTAKIKDGLL